MVEFVNRLTGGRMWVHETRVEEYIAAGHKPAASSRSSAAVRRTQKKTPKK